MENPGDLYRGCREFRFADLELGVLERTGGILNIVTQIIGYWPFLILRRFAFFVPVFLNSTIHPHSNSKMETGYRL
ncbi:MAG: hypothetical protein IPL83_01340 [Bdellovibrionales bacterium]|nr:hypothetical protein [Bdellovibrionales bacterium]